MATTPLTQGQLDAQANLDRLMALTPEAYAQQYSGIDQNSVVMADRRIQDMLTSSEGAFDQRQYEKLLAERQALVSQGGGRAALAQQDYAEQLKHAQETVQWWKENPDGANPTMRKLMPFVAAVMAVVATAGAASSAMGAATTAGNTVAAAGATGAAAVNGAVTVGVGSAAAAGGTSAAAVAATTGAMQVVTITGAKLAVPALVNAAVAAGAVGATAVAAAGSGAAPAAGSEMQTVEIKGERPVPTGGLPVEAAVGAGAAGVGIAGGDMPVVQVPGVRPAPGIDPSPALEGVALGALPINHTALENLPDVQPTKDPTKLPSAPKGGDDKESTLGGALTGPALAAALAGLTSEKMPENAQLNGSIDKLTSNADKQMAEWNDWMFPKLKGALADNKTATDDFVGKANANASQMESMGASARGLGDLYAQRNRDVYIPLADKIIADANKFNKEGFAEQQAGLAVGDLGSAYAAQREQMAQQRAQYGVDPSSGRAMAIDAAGGINMAANSAAAATRARMAAEELWGKKQVDALGTSAPLNANAATINSSYTTAGGLYSGATGVRQQGVKATSDYFTNASDLAKTSTNTYNSANNALSSAGQLGLGKSKIEGDRYIAEQQGRGQVIGAGLQAINQNGGVVKTVGDTIGAIGTTWNALKGLWE